MSDPLLLAFVYMHAVLYPPLVMLRLGTAWGSYCDRY